MIIVQTNILCSFSIKPCFCKKQTETIFYVFFGIVKNGIKNTLKMVRNNTEIDSKRPPAGTPQKGVTGLQYLNIASLDGFLLVPALWGFIDCTPPIWRFLGIGVPPDTYSEHCRWSPKFIAYSVVIGQPSMSFVQVKELR